MVERRSGFKGPKSEERLLASSDKEVELDIAGNIVASWTERKTPKQRKTN